MRDAGTNWMVLFLGAGLIAAGISVPGVSQAQTVKIGVIQPITGPIAYGGQAAANGHKLAVKDINAGGGVDVKGKKYKIELVIEDSKGVPKESMAAANKLISRDRVPLIMGDFTSSSTFASAEVCEREGIPIISPLSSSPKLTSSGLKYFFRGERNANRNFIMDPHSSPNQVNILFRMR